MFQAFKQEKEEEYGILEITKIIKTADLTLNNCSFNWTSLKDILKGFNGN